MGIPRVTIWVIRLVAYLLSPTEPPSWVRKRDSQYGSDHLNHHSCTAPREE